MYNLFYITGFMVKKTYWLRVVVRTIVVLCTGFVRLRAMSNFVVLFSTCFTVSCPPHVIICLVV